MKKVSAIVLNALPILLMIGLIPLVSDDYILATAYVVIIIAALMIKRELNDLPVLVFGFFAMILSEYIFVSTGVETFQRNTLFGMMPIWLPVLWAYGFVVIKRSVEIISH